MKFKGVGFCCDFYFLVLDLIGLNLDFNLFFVIKGLRERQEEVSWDVEQGFRCENVKFFR